MVTACVLMGLWQLGIYGSKQDDSSRDLSAAKPVRLLDVWGPDEPFDANLSGRPVLVAGVFTGEQAVVQRVGSRYWAIAPLRIAGTKSSLVVVRGWSGAEPPPVPRGKVAFKATLQPTEDIAGTFDPSAGVYPSVSISALANVFGDDLFSGYAVTSAPEITAGLEPVQPQAPDVSWTVGLRNLAYAMQWWLFGLFSLFMWRRMATEE